jgi:hypothetical protein
VQDVAQLARLLLTVLVDDGLRQRLAIAARATALQFAPSIIADRQDSSRKHNKPKHASWHLLKG